MKKEYVYCILSIILLSLGVTCCAGTLFLNSINDSSKSVLATFGICFLLIGFSGYAEHNKKYFKIKHLKNSEVPVIANWQFKCNSSNMINQILYDKKLSASSTIILSCVLCLVLSFCVFFSGEENSLYIMRLLISISIAGTLIALILNSYYYTLKLSSDSEALIGEDYIYFLDELHTLQKSIYFLYDVRIDYSSEISLQFLYGDYDLFRDPVYSISIPIPPEELTTAEFVQRHYLNLIHYE
jgi:hypothetical protein